MRNSATHEYMENLNFSWTDDSIRFINTATPKAVSYTHLTLPTT